MNSDNDFKILKASIVIIHSLLLAASQVFFSELKYTYVETEAAYTALALMCDIGGALGLILGSTCLLYTSPSPRD